MKERLRAARHRLLFPVVLGLTDGILTALTLAAGQLTELSGPMPLAHALDIATAALVSGAFVFYVARYAQLRRELVHAQRQLNILTRGRLASTRLGHSVLKEALVAAVVSSLASFGGALIPLLGGALLPWFRWGSATTSMAALGVLGIGLAHDVHGRYWLWCSALVAGGLIVTVVGIELHIV